MRMILGCTYMCRHLCMWGAWDVCSMPWAPHPPGSGSQATVPQIKIALSLAPSEDQALRPFLCHQSDGGTRSQLASWQGQWGRRAAATSRVGRAQWNSQTRPSGARGHDRWPRSPALSQPSRVNLFLLVFLSLLDALCGSLVYQAWCVHLAGFALAGCSAPAVCMSLSGAGTYSEFGQSRLKCSHISHAILTQRNPSWLLALLLVVATTSHRSPLGSLTVVWPNVLALLGGHGPMSGQAHAQCTWGPGASNW